MAGLADTRQQFVDRLGGIHHSVARSHALFTHGMVGAIKRVKRRMWQPRLVKVQVVHIAVKHALDGFGVVEHAVISGLGQSQNARLDFLGVCPLKKGVGLDFGLNGFGLKFALRNRANDAEMVARRL